MADKQEVKKSNGGKIFLIILAVLLLGLNIFQFIWNMKNTRERDDIISEKETIIEEQESTIDSQLAELDSITASLEKVKTEKEALGLDISSLEEQIEKLRKDRNYYARNFIKPSVRKEMENTIANYKNILQEQEKTIQNLTASRDSLFNENTVLKEEIVHINDTIIELEKIQHDQEEELKVGRRLKVSGLNISAIKKPEKGKKKFEEDQVYKKKDLVQTHLEFNIDPNPIALIEQKEIYVQVLDANKKVVFNMDKGSGKFTVEKASGAKEMTYTIKQNITYQRTNQKLSMTFENPTEYEPGIHTVRVWCEDAVIGSSTFTVK